MSKLFLFLLVFAFCHGGQKPATVKETGEGISKIAQKTPARPLGSYFKKQAPQPLPVVKTGSDFGRAVARSIDFLLENNKRPGAKLASGLQLWPTIRR